MRNLCLIGIIMLVAALAAPAQDGGRLQRGPRPALGRGPNGAGAAAFGPLVRRLAAELNLTDAQKPQYDALVAKYQAQAESQPAQRDSLRELARQLRDARQSGDTARAEEIQTQMREARGSGLQSLRGFLAELEPLLDDAQREKLASFRTRLGRGADASGRGADLRSLMQRLPTELGLSEQQRTQYQTLVAEQRQQLQQNQQRWRELQPLLDELRAARDSGDQARVAELQAQLDQQRPTPPDFQSFFAKLEPILTDDQKAKLTELRANAGPAAQGPTDVRQVLRAAQQLDLTDQQKERLKEIAREAQSVERASADAAGRVERTSVVKQRVLEVLDPNQAAQFERLMARGERPGRAGPRGAGPGRGPGPGAGDNTP